MLPFNLTFEQVAPTVLAIIAVVGAWLSARTRRRGDAESNVMDRLETIIKRSDEQLKAADIKITTLSETVEELKADRDKQNRNIGILTAFAHRTVDYMKKHLPDRTDVPELPELEE